MRAGSITTEKLRGPHRLFYLRNAVARVLDAASPVLVVYEDYAFSRRGNNMFHLGELGGVLKTLMWERGIAYMEVSPSLMKAVITGHGRAEKSEIIDTLRTLYGFSLPRHDEADAAALMLLGEMRRGECRIPATVPEKSRKALRACPIQAGKLQTISRKPAERSC